MQYLNRIVAILAVLWIAGCGNGGSGPTGTVAGRVTLGGEPITEGTVNFFSESLGVGMLAPISDQGDYSISTGLPVGEYAVTVNGIEATPDNPVVKPTKIPQKYWQANTSGLTFQIARGKSQFDIELSEK